MTPSKIQQRVLTDRLATIDDLIEDIQSLPLSNQTDFLSDNRNVWAGESCLRRCLEALLDIGRHILAKGFGKGVTEYKEIASELNKVNVIAAGDEQLLREMAGYRNRMVHFYHEISKDELYEILQKHLKDIVQIESSYKKWILDNKELVE